MGLRVGFAILCIAKPSGVPRRHNAVVSRELDSGPISQNKKTPPSTGRCAARVFEKSTKSMIPHTLLYAAPLPGISGYGDI